MPFSEHRNGHGAATGLSAAFDRDIARRLTAQALLTRAATYGESRLVCGMHFSTDVVAGQALGTAVAVDLLHNPALWADRDAAAAELRAAHLAD